MKQGFTLIELVLVLVILSVLATVALETVEPEVDQTRFEASQRTVDSVRDAIFDEQLIADGRTIYTGFVVDMGRPPVTRVDVVDNSLLTASELWDQQALQSYGAIEANSTNITSNDAENKKDADGDVVVEDTDVFVRFGWRGPYLQLPSGASNLFDGFGHRMTSSTVSTSLSHLRADGDTAITAAATPFLGVRSFGRSDTIDFVPSRRRIRRNPKANGDAYENDVPAVKAGQILGVELVEGSVTGTVTYRKRSVLDPDISAADIVVQLYYPNGQKVFVQRASNESSTENVDEVEETTPATTTAYQTFKYSFRDAVGSELGNFPVGSRVIRAYYKIGNSTEGRQSAVMSFILTSPTSIQNLAINN